MSNYKMYQVFVSSTYEDLKDERNKVLQALLRIDCIPIGMEYFNAADEDQFTVIKDLISSCDYYVLILGGKYGSIEEKSQKSYTQLEYEYAKSQNIPTIAFFRKDLQTLTGDKLEQDINKKEKLEAFTNTVKSQLCMAYTNADNLALNVITSLSKLKISHPRSGWIHGDSVASSEANQKILDLQRENEVLKKEIASYQVGEKEKQKSYQQGEDELRLVIHSCNASNPFGIELSEKPIEFSLSWDMIFKIVGSSFISPVQTNMAIEMVDKLICRFKESDENSSLDVQCAQTILSQFYALGYLELQTGEVFQSGVMSYYVLTKYGIKHLVELSAIKK